MRSVPSSRFPPWACWPSFLLWGCCFTLTGGPCVGCRASPPSRRSPGEALGPIESLAAGPGCKPGQSGISSSFDQQKLQEALSSQREQRGRCVPWDHSNCDSNPKEQNNLGEWSNVERGKKESMPSFWASLLFLSFAYMSRYSLLFLGWLVLNNYHLKVKILFNQCPLHDMYSCLRACMHTHTGTRQAMDYLRPVVK